MEERFTPDPARGENTTATGAAVGAASAGVLIWLLEKVPWFGDIPSGVEGAILVIVVYLVSRVLPPLR